MAAKEWAAQVMVRLTAEDLGALELVQQPGEARASAYTRVMREAVLPADVLLRYRKLPLFPDWQTWGPFSPVAADERGRHMRGKGFEVEARHVAPAGPPAVWPDDEPCACESCGAASGAAHDPECER